MAIYNYTVLKTSQKGTLLITDGTKISWVIKRAQRKDGTFGDGALRALEASKITGSTLEDYNSYTNSQVSVNFKWASKWETDKAWLLDWVWMPKSLCSIVKNEDKTFTITGPRWVLLKKFTEEEIDKGCSDF